MLRIFTNRLDGSLVEALRVDDGADVALMQEINERLRNTTNGKAHLNLALCEERFKETGRCEGCSTTTGLEGEAILKIRRRRNPLPSSAPAHPASYE